jgi:hypothetical protein
VHIRKIEEDEGRCDNGYAGAPDGSCQNQEGQKETPPGKQIEFHQFGTVFYFKDSAVKDEKNTDNGHHQ